MKKRVDYLDLLRIVASAFVVFMHTAAQALRTDVAGHTGWFLLAGLSSLAFCAVPLFFMITGYLLTTSDRTKDVRVLLKVRLPRLIVPLLFWSLLYVLRGLIINRSFSIFRFGAMLLSMIRQPVNISLWFMYALIGMYLISPLLCGGLRSLSAGQERLLLGLILAIKGIGALRVVFPAFGEKYLNFEILNYLDAFKGHLACFLLGWFLGKTERRIPQSALWVVAVAVWGIITTGTIMRSSLAGDYLASFQSQTGGFEILLAGCIFLIAKQSSLSGKASMKKITHALSPCTFPIYLMHNLLLLLFGSFQTTSLLGVLCNTILIYTVALSIAWISRFVPTLSYLVCGLPHRRWNFDTRSSS